MVIFNSYVKLPEGTLSSDLESFHQHDLAVAALSQQGQAAEASQQPDQTYGQVG